MAELNINQILVKEDDPRGLENLYRSDPDAFEAAMRSAVSLKPESVSFQFWQARFERYSEVENPSVVPIAVVLMLAAVFGLIVRIPEIFLTEIWYYPRFAPFFTVLSVATYFLLKNFNRSFSIGLMIFAILTSTYLTLLPEWQSSDSIIMALIHLPFTVFICLGLCFVQQAWRETVQRVAFVEYCGELLVLSTLILIGGGVLTASTVGLFALMDVDVLEWYMPNVGLIGIVSTPLVATYLYDSVLQRKLHIAVLLAKVFSPLFLIFVLSYMVTMIAMGNSPFVHREFLVVFNGLLVLILGMVVFTVVTRHKDAQVSIVDYVNIALISATLLLNALALAAILYRLAEYGFTPNRFCVLGVNLIVFVHLIIIMTAYIKVMYRQIGFDMLRESVVRYFPVYCCWFVFVTYLIPLVFGFV